MHYDKPFIDNIKISSKESYKKMFYFDDFIIEEKDIHGNWSLYYIDKKIFPMKKEYVKLEGLIYFYRKNIEERIKRNNKLGLYAI